jgi:hypothetical protein
MLCGYEDDRFCAAAKSLLRSRGGKQQPLNVIGSSRARTAFLSAAAATAPRDACRGGHRQ